MCPTYRVILSLTHTYTLYAQSNKHRYTQCTHICIYIICVRPIFHRHYFYTHDIICTHIGKMNKHTHTETDTVAHKRVALTSVEEQSKNADAHRGLVYIVRVKKRMLVILGIDNKTKLCSLLFKCISKVSRPRGG